MRTSIFLAVLLLATPIAAETTAEVRPVLKQAQSLHKTGQYQEAVELYRRVLARTSLGDAVNDQARVGLCHARRAGKLGLAEVERAPSTEPRPVESSVEKPVPIYKPDAEYTKTTRKARIQGVIISQTIVDREGCITKIDILKSLHPELDQALKEVATTWVMRPATINGMPVDVYYNFTTNFAFR